MNLYQIINVLCILNIYDNLLSIIITIIHRFHDLISWFHRYLSFVAYHLVHMVRLVHRVAEVWYFYCLWIFCFVCAFFILVKHVKFTLSYFPIVLTSISFPIGWKRLLKVYKIKFVSANKYVVYIFYIQFFESLW